MFGKAGARKVSKKIEELNEISTPAVSVASALLKVTNEYASQLTLPYKANLFKVSQRSDKKGFDPLTDPARRNFDVPEKLQSFLLQDTRKENQEKITVIGDNEMVNYLQSSPSWLADGTFKLSPKMFYQLYTVHIQDPEMAPACVFAFYQTKQKAHINVFRIFCRSYRLQLSIKF